MDVNGSSKLLQLVAQIKEQTQETEPNHLLMLVNGPKAHFRSLFCYQRDLAAFQISFEHDLFNKVPLTGTITIDQLAIGGTPRSKCRMIGGPNVAMLTGANV
ncbi:hypothetical protein GQ44DRAFT_733167 [Phaeosphaeriaceae sp. PMI808]|nr:hypothetical protein GQ44DRAFT_733167 [Phaeosphaeriaceae sp. PMI808]